jgi:putative transposase
MRRRKQIRLREYDYSSAGAYFLTVCVKDGIGMFGEIVDGEMIQNEYGNIVKSCWDELHVHYSQIELDAFIVMPNHVHGIIIIHDSVGAIHELPLRWTPRQRRQMLLPKIVGRFKQNSAKRINELRGSPPSSVWQRNYFDHIIRNEKSLNRIREYIVTNPERWQWDAGSSILHHDFSHSI